MTARCVMVLGTTSGAGKSWLATALCRWYARAGLRVAPFKAQNMSNNARVVPRPHVREDLASVPWRARSELLWPAVREALRALLGENDVVVIEGAGSPAEINL